MWRYEVNWAGPDELLLEEKDKIFVLQGRQLTGGWGILHNE
jgi:hypothetical protein